MTSRSRGARPVRPCAGEMGNPMAGGVQRRTRSERIAALELPPGQWERAWENLSRRDVLGRVGLAFLAAALLVGLIGAWNPPFAYHVGDVPSRDIISRVSFQRANPEKTLLARHQAAAQVPYCYTQDPRPLIELRKELRNAVAQLTAAENLDKAEPKLLEIWRQFEGEPADGGSPPTPEDREARFRRFREQFAGPENLAQLDRALAVAFAPFEQRGLLDSPSGELGRGNPDEAIVRPRGAPEPLLRVKLAEVLLGDKSAVQQSLRAHVPPDETADLLFNWVKPRLTPTLEVDLEQTAATRQKASDAVAEVTDVFKAGQLLVAARDPKTNQPIRLSAEQIELLRLEDQAAQMQRTAGEQIVRALTALVLIFVMFVLCGVYMRYRQRGPLDSVSRLLTLIVMAAATVGGAKLLSADPWRAELIPLLLFGMTMSVAYRQELALVVVTAIALIVTLAAGHDLYEFALLMSVTTVGVVNVGRIRTRRKLIYVGLACGTLAAVLDVAIALLNNHPLNVFLFTDAARIGLWGLAAGFLMTGLLPFIEQVFGVLTDLSLLELGDVSHPLLQELVRRAPSTYNHSLTVGSIAEAAAEAIGARGLFVRVGAYFHDIGKMLKPGYFVENQGAEGSRHEGLVPAMSTLVIIAHIKDGSDLARQYRLPQPIIDLIVQHHGTTLVEYFYDRAHERSQTDPNGDEPDENLFRYPGPKPQTKEAAVLMLTDAVESASRTLIDPAPARIESLVRSIAERRLHDGQFDESGLTLRELRTIEKSLVMSLISIYHGRIKYPEPRGEARPDARDARESRSEPTAQRMPAPAAENQQNSDPAVSTAAPAATKD